MKVFVFCFTILLFSAVKASPLSSGEVEGEILNNENENEALAEVEVMPEDESMIEVGEPLLEAVGSEPEIVDLPEAAEESPEAEALPEDDAVPEPFFKVEEESDSVDEETVQDNEIESEDSLINEPSESQEAQPYEDDAKALQVEEKPKLTQEEMEKTFGIEIPECSTLDTNPRIPLHLSHLTSCGKFYKCYNGRGYLMDCPAGEHWSVNLNRCDYASVARCKINGKHQYKIKKTKPMQASSGIDEDETKPETGDFEIDPRCEGSDPFKPLHYKHVNDCTKFYKCYMGKAYVIKCPRGQQWAQALNRCEHPSIAKCTIKPAAIKPAQAMENAAEEANSSEESDSSEESEEYEYYDYGPSIVDDPDYQIVDARCAPDETDIFHPVQFSHPTDCNMFYKCFDHRAIKIQCPGGLHYSEEEERCDYPEEAKCQVEVMEAQANFPEPSIPNCAQNEKAKFPVEGSFTSYFSCENGLAYLMECQNQEIFNPMTKTCENFQMPQYPMMPMSPDFQFPGWMQQFPGGVQPQFPGMQIPIAPPQIPNQRPRPQNPEAERPQRPEFPSWMPSPNPNVQVPEMPTVEKPSHEKPTDKNQFNYQNGKPNSRCPSSDNPSKPQHLSHENDCNKFYKCFNGRAFMMECPIAQEWSDELQRCDYHQFANCNAADLLKKKIQA